MCVCVCVFMCVCVGNGVIENALHDSDDSTRTHVVGT